MNVSWFILKQYTSATVSEVTDYKQWLTVSCQLRVNFFGLLLQRVAGLCEWKHAEYVEPLWMLILPRISMFICSIRRIHQTDGELTISQLWCARVSSHSPYQHRH